MLFTYCLLTTEDSLVETAWSNQILTPWSVFVLYLFNLWPHFTLKDIPSRPYLKHTCSFLQCGDTHESLFLPHNCRPSWPFLESCFSLCFGPVILLERVIYLFVIWLLNGRSWFRKLYIYLAGLVLIFIILISRVELLQCRAPCSEERELQSSMSSELRLSPSVLITVLYLLIHYSMPTMNTLYVYCISLCSQVTQNFWDEYMM